MLKFFNCSQVWSATAISITCNRLASIVILAVVLGVLGMSTVHAAPEVLANYDYVKGGNREVSTDNFAIPAGTNRTLFVSVGTRTASRVGTNYVTVEWARLDNNSNLGMTKAVESFRAFDTDIFGSSKRTSATLLYRHLDDSITGNHNVRIRMRDSLTENRVIHVLIMGNIDPGWSPTHGDGNNTNNSSGGTTASAGSLQATRDFVVIDSVTHHAHTASINSQSPSGKTRWVQNTTGESIQQVMGFYIYPQLENNAYSYTFSSSNQWAAVACTFRSRYRVVYTAGPNGLVSGVPVVTQNVIGTQNATTVIAQPNAGYYFAGWSDGVATASRTETDVTENISVTANFLPIMNVSPVMLTIQTKTYDGGIAATLTGGGLDNVAAGDDVMLNTGYAVANFNNKHAGEDKSVTVTGLSLSGAHAYKYNLVGGPTWSTTGTIEPRTLTLSNFIAGSRTYDGTQNVGGTGFSNDRLTGDNVTFSFNASFADKNVGDDKLVNFSNIVISGGADAGNYTLAATTGQATANVTPRALNLSAFTANNKPYDGNTSVTGGAFNDNRITGDLLEFSFNAAFEDRNAGTGKRVLFTDIEISGGADSGNYALATISGIAENRTIFARGLSLPGLTAEGKEYDRSRDAVISDYGPLDGVIGGDLVDLDTSGSVANFAFRTVGDHTVTVSNLALSGVDNSNYTISAQTTVDTHEITPRSLGLVGLTANDKVEDGFATATISSFGVLAGVIIPDQVALDSGAYEAHFDSPDVGDNKPVTVTGLALSGADAFNYSLDGPWVTTASILINAHTIEASRSAGGDITPFGNVVVINGNDRTFFIEADNNYVIDSLLVDGSEISAASGEKTYSYTFTNVTTDHSISVVFRQVITITLVGGSLTLECGEDEYEEPGATAVDGQGQPINVSINANELELNETGQYPIFYNATDGINTAVVTRLVTVVDTMAPVIAADDIVLECGIDDFIEDATAWDACEGNVTAQIVVVGSVDTQSVAAYPVTYNVEDSLGNDAVPVTRTVTVQDSTPPVITLLGDDPVVTSDGNNYDPAGGYLAADACDGSLTGAVVVAPIGPDWRTNVPGEYEIEYRVSDSSGNEAAEKRIVVVRPLGCDLAFDITASPNPVRVGEKVVFEAVERPESCHVGLLEFQWLFRAAGPGEKDEFVVIDNAPNASIYVLEDADFSDVGTYKCIVTDVSDIFETAVIALVVEWGVPAAGIAGMALAALVVALAGAGILKRR